MAPAFGCHLGRTAVPRTGSNCIALTTNPGRGFFQGTALAPELRRGGRGHKVVTSAQMVFDAVGTSYANALVELAQSKNVLDQVHTDVDSLQSIFRDNEDVREFLFNPIVSEEKKKEVLKSLAKEAGLTDYTLNFLSLLVDRDRLVAAEEIFTAFENEYCKLTETQVATLRSAVKLEQEQHFLIAKKLQELTGSKNIKLKPVIDESLIAGFIVEYGSSQIDLSVKGQLDRITQELTAGQPAAA